MRRHMIAFAPIYMVAIGAVLLALLASLGLFTNLFGTGQLLVVARVMVITTVLILLSVTYWRR
jgi:hypothetical protein